MKLHQKSQDNTPNIIKKKVYSKPILNILGKVSELTAGGSGPKQEGASVNSGGEKCGPNQGRFC